MSALFWYAFTKRWVAHFPSGRGSNSGLDRVAASRQIRSNCTAFIGEIGMSAVGDRGSGIQGGRASPRAGKAVQHIRRRQTQGFSNTLGFVNGGSRGRDPSRVFGRIRGRSDLRRP